MKKHLKKVKKEHSLYVIGVVLALILTFIITFLLLKPQKNLISTPQSMPDFVSPYIQTMVGKTTTDQLDEMPDLEDKIASGSYMMYRFKSPIIPRDNVVITNNGKVIFERAVTIDDKLTEYPKINPYFETYGSPDSVIRGSRFYGKYTTHYIYASKGFTLIASPFTGEIYEINIYEPTTVADYLKNWGADVYSAPLIENYSLEIK